MKYALLCITTLLIMGCSDETTKSGEKEVRDVVKASLVPQTKNEKLKPPAVPTL